MMNWLMNLEVQMWNLHLVKALNTYIQEAEFLYSLLNTEGKRKMYISLIYTKTSQYTWRLRIPNCSTDKLGADSAFLSKTGLRIYFQCVCSCISAGSDTLYQGQPAEETFLPVHDGTTSLGSREAENRLEKQGLPWPGVVK